MFTDLGFIDKNFTMDITKDLDNVEQCFWFTIPIAIYKMVDANNKEYNNYEYLSFPVTATEDEHIRFFSAEQPYYWNHDYAGSLNTMFGDE